MPFLDFAEIKARTTFEQLVTRLDLNVKRSGNQWRGPCQACNSGGDRALVITDGKGFFCFADKKGGDQIALVAHILDVPAKQAAEWIVGIPTGTSKVPEGTVSRSTVPESDRGKETQKLQPLAYLEHDHDAVAAVGFDPEFCKTHGIGYAPKGIARGHVLIPFRDENGVLLGYVGVTEAWLPADFQSNVVKLPKRA